nr:uncharacterized protein LOC121117029 [Lepeophtheirus salmonis]
MSSFEGKFPTVSPNIKLYDKKLTALNILENQGIFTTSTLVEEARKIENTIKGKEPCLIETVSQDSKTLGYNPSIEEMSSFEGKIPTVPPNIKLDDKKLTALNISENQGIFSTSTLFEEARKIENTTEGKEPCLIETVSQDSKTLGYNPSVEEMCSFEGKIPTVPPNIKFDDKKLTALNISENQGIFTTSTLVEEARKIENTIEGKEPCLIETVSQDSKTLGYNPSIEEMSSFEGKIPTVPPNIKLDDKKLTALNISENQGIFTTSTLVEEARKIESTTEGKEPNLIETVSQDSKTLGVIKFKS